MLKKDVRKAAELYGECLKAGTFDWAFLFVVFLMTEEQVLKDTEKIEHNISEETFQCIGELLEYFRAYPSTIKEFREFQAAKRK